ncbi:MAG TPA: hypothetical protein VGQ15_00240 [Gaiellaceae bacterium]|nr:hypothetical protein [Gaiellaceae bacterium]
MADDVASAECQGDRLRPGVNVQLGQDVLDVSPDRARADDEPGRDLRLGQALGKERQHLGFASGERAKAR